jgi:hypothetical protein
MKTIKYQRIEIMEPREGVSYSTKYLKQSLEQRMELTRHVKQAASELLHEIERMPDPATINTPLKGFKTTTGKNRSAMDILVDMLTEARGKKRDGKPKDYALAPIERWNKLFKGTDYEINLVQADGMKSNNFNDLMDF